MTRVPPLLAAVLLAVAMNGCSGDDSSSDGAAATSSTTASLGTADRYVSLGSSIASGFGIPVQSDCGRSTVNYPRLVAARLDLDLVDVSCGGAVVPNVLDTAQGDHPPQITAITADTKLITISIGGNDIAYNGTALACGDPATVCTAPDDLDSDLSSLPGALADMIEQIRGAAPDAAIVFVTYPREVPDANCPDLSLTDEEAEMLRSMGERLEAVFVAFAEDTGVLLVDPYVEPGDHTGCAPPSERWAAGYVAPDGFAYHPTALGHEVMADLIVSSLGR